MSDYNTKPTIENVFEKLNALTEEMRQGFAAIAVRLDRIEERLTSLEQRYDHQEDKIDIFIREVLDLRRALKHPV
jgi:uncharacterized coiled-coil protein SlyX